MTRVTIRVKVDPESLLSQIDDVANNIGTIDNVGADGDSSYEISSVNTSSTDDPLEFEVEFDLERLQGKFVSKEDLADAIVEEFDTEIDSINVEGDPK